MIPFRIYAILGLMILAAAGAWRYQYIINENERLKTQLSVANRTVAAMDEAAVKKTAIHETERNRLDEINHSPESDDGPVAPVLRRVIDGLH